MSNDPWAWHCIRCQRRITARFWLCRDCERDLRCKGSDLTADNPRCQPGGDLYIIYELKCMERADRDRARAAARREISVDPDLLLHPQSEDPDDREDGWGAPPGVAEARIVRADHYGVTYQMAAERSWYTGRKRPPHVWRYTRPEWAVELTLWAPYPDDNLNKAYRRVCRLHRMLTPKPATETADDQEGLTETWRAELAKLLTTVALSPAERQILELARKGERQVDIAATTGLSQSRISQVLSAALAKLRGPQARPARDPWRRTVYPKKATAPTGGAVVRDKPYNTEALRSYWRDNPEKARWRESPKHLR